MTNPPNSQAILCEISNCAFEAVSDLLSRDQLLAKELRNSETISRQIFREECITLEMASRLKERFPAQIEIIVFTPAEETQNGADWYWRIQKGAGAIHARVQAKRIQRSAFGQADPDGTVDLDRGQLRTLVDAANRDQTTFPGLQAWISTFGRYDATPPCGVNPCKCKKHQCGGRCSGKVIPSVWIAQAEDFINDGSQSLRLPIREVVEISLRLDCILPCIDHGTEDGPAVKGYSLAYGLPSFDSCVAAIQSNPTLRGEFRGALQLSI
jgi:hypothetical protein